VTHALDRTGLSSARAYRARDAVLGGIARERRGLRQQRQDRHRVLEQRERRIELSGRRDEHPIGAGRERFRQRHGERFRLAITRGQLELAVARRTRPAFQHGTAEQQPRNFARTRGHEATSTGAPLFAAER
jgi:hypothetical protein